MSYSRKQCRWCGRPASDARPISRSGSCAACAIDRAVRVALANIEAGVVVAPASMARERERDRARRHRERTAP